MVHEIPHSGMKAEYIYYCVSVLETLLTAKTRLVLQTRVNPALLSR